MSARRTRLAAESRAAADAAPRPADAFDCGPDYVQSLHRGLDVIRAFGVDRPALSLAEIARETGLSRAVVRRLLMTLGYLGYVDKRGRAFTLTPRVLDLGYRYLSSLPVAQFALPVMERLARSIGESCSLGVLDGDDVVYVQRVSVRKVMTINLSVGARLPAYCTSMGRILVANLPAADRDRWLAAVEPASRTQFTITDRSALGRELDRVRAQGFSYVQQELELGLCSAAVPVHGRSGETIAALNVGLPFGPGARARALGEILSALRRACREIDSTYPDRSDSVGSAERIDRRTRKAS